ncbi:hypothetical protein V8E53_012350 [Lactarius tabidus]
MAEALRARIILSDIVKGGLTSSMGDIPSMGESTSVPVTCDRRLCDSQSHVYQFHARVGRAFHSDKLQVSLPLVTSRLVPQGTSTPTLDARTDFDSFV